MDRDFSLSQEEFNSIAELIYGKIGIRYDDKKIYFLNNRIRKRMDELKFKSFSEYYKYLKYMDAQSLEFQNLVNAITVNETYFFRDYPQLESFVMCLQDLAEKKASIGDRTMRIWSVGCSSGEEPYTLSIILHEVLDKIGSWNITIQAVDIDQNILKRAIQGKYELRSIKECPKEYLDKYFDSLNGFYYVKEDVRKLINFEHLNIMDFSNISYTSTFDFVFCRNVLIYFDDISRRQVVDTFYTSLKKGGYLFLGSSESPSRITNAFKLMRKGKFLVYGKD